MKIAFYCVFYGKEYLAWSIRSIQDAVDEIHVIYSDRPSFGHQSEMVCPDSEEELKAEANRFLKKPLFWHRGRWGSEGDHRNAIMPIARDRGVDQILVVDADEIWDPESAKAVLDEAKDHPERNLRVRFLHFWRSFKWVCKDPAMPVRVILPKRPENTEGYIASQPWPVFHFGYAQSAALTRFKWTFHGHLSELRPGWFDNKFVSWNPGVKDVHPTCVDFWNPQPSDETLLRVLEPLLKDHPNWGKEIIP